MRESISKDRFSNTHLEEMYGSFKSYRASVPFSKKMSTLWENGEYIFKLIRAGKRAGEAMRRQATWIGLKK